MEDKGKTTGNPNMHAIILLVIGIILFILGNTNSIYSWRSSSRFRWRRHCNYGVLCCWLLLALDFRYKPAK